MTFPRIAAKPLLAALLFFLAACAAQDGILPSCPKATILEDAATLTRFRDGPGRDPIDVNFTGRIEHLNGSCIFNTDKSGAGVLNMDVQVGVRVDRGPANQDHKAEFEYFVTILDSGGNVLTKELFPFGVEFFGASTTSRDTDAPILLVIPVTASQVSQDFSVFVGFQLTPEEVRYNRENRRGGNS